jgi:hypothetical protein
MTMYSARRLLAGAAVAVLTAACSGDDAPTPTETGVGTVTGRIVAADGSTPIPGAAVQLAARQANGPVDPTDLERAYTLVGLPAGVQTLVATRGVFLGQFTVTVRANQTVTANPTAVQPTGNLGYVAGDYDRIESIVRDDLGYPMTALEPASLGTTATLNAYKMLFVNCGAELSEVIGDASALDNLKAWVAAGGVLYASDLSLDLIQAMFPEHILSVLYGNPQDVTAQVISESIRSSIGKSSVAIRYDLPSWTTPDGLSATAEVLLRGTFVSGDQTYADKPLAILIPHGSGKVVFTSFHNESGLTPDQLALLRYYVFLPL